MEMEVSILVSLGCRWRVGLISEGRHGELSQVLEIFFIFMCSVATGVHAFGKRH
jgi:hypothetical protein